MLPRGLFGVPASALLADLALSLKPRKDSIEIVLLDPHLRGELRDRDSGLGLDEGECLGAT
jgi:hypothetical protein